MNILINCLSLISGGAVSYLSNLLPKLDRLFQESNSDHSITILAHQEQKKLFPSVPQSRCILLENSRPKGYRRFLWEYRNLGDIARDHNIDVLFTPYQISPHVNGVKHVLMFHNMDTFCFENYKYTFKPWLRNKILFSQSRRSLCNADRIIAVSDYVEQVLVDRLNISSNRISRIYHGRDENFCPDGDIENDTALLAKMGIIGPYILTCGSLWPYRRCEDVIKAFDLHRKGTRQEVSLVIAGSKAYTPYRKVIEELISQSPSSNRIHAIDHISYTAMPALYRNCLCCVLATEVEACPIIAIEAMSSGCLILSSDRPPLPEILNGCSLQFQARNVSEIAHKMCQGIEDVTIRDSRKQMAIKNSKEFSWHRCAEQTYSALVEWD